MAKKPTIYFCLTIIEGFELFQVFAFNFVLSSPAEDTIFYCTGVCIMLMMRTDLSFLPLNHKKN